MSDVEHISTILERHRFFNKRSQMLEFTVKAKDLQQDIIHKSNVLARTQRSANAKFMHFLRESMGHKDFEVL